MSYQWIDDHGLAGKPCTERLGERRTDHQTAARIRDALQACSVRVAAQALQDQQVDFATALRVLAKPGWRRGCR